MFEILIYLTFAAVLLTLGQTNAPLPQGARGGHDVAILLWFAWMFPLVWMAAHRRRNWARWTLLGLFLLETAWFYFRARNLLAFSTWTEVHVFLTALEAAAYAFAFTRSSQRWFGKDIPDVAVF